MIQLDYRDARPIYAQIVDGYRSQILSGILEKGEKLPSVRELATQLTINPNTIQRAYRELEMEGWIASVPGKGSFVAGVPGGGQPEQLALLEKFDDLIARLLNAGVTKAELTARIDQGGNTRA